MELAIEKLALVHLVGPMARLDETLVSCLKAGCFHPENAIHSRDLSKTGLTTLDSTNPYTVVVNSICDLAKALKLKLCEHEFDEKQVGEDMLPPIRDYVSLTGDKIRKLDERKREIKENISHHKQAAVQLKHLEGLDTNFDEIFSCEYVKVRFGKLPIDSYPKLAYYDDKTFFFFPFEHDSEYYWGVYFAPSTKVAVIDDVFTSLYFERLRVPDYAHGTPEVALKAITDLLEKEEKELEELRGGLEKLKDENAEIMLTYYSMLQFASATYSLRKYAATVNNRFYIEGFIPQSEAESFAARFSDGVSCTIAPHDADPSITPPVKLKNNRFAKPFEMFVDMYSLPSYNDIDPTSIVAVTYTLLFGLMFGDVGQGLVIALVGLIMRNRIKLGRIMIRIGLSSALFGFLYGSVFGFEHWLDPLYKNVFGLAEKPVEVFDTSTTNLILMAAIAIGVTLIVISMLINIYNGIRSKDIGKALFSHNGVAGLVFFLSAAYAILDMMLLQKGVVNGAYIVCFFVIPILCIFLKDPLTKLCHGRKDFMPKNIVEFIIENFFELFEYVLSYLSNSMSFLRVGGFILSHAGMMAVVMSLSDMMSDPGGVNIIVVVIGNIFVMALEGLIVGIQVLRLEFYEMFSRHFEGNGEPFSPITVNYQIEN